MEEKHINSNVHDFDVSGDFIWISRKENAILLDTLTHQEWEYNWKDGIHGQKIYGINCDADWVWFLTNKGITYYNWGRFHHKKY